MFCHPWWSWPILIWAIASSGSWRYYRTKRRSWWYLCVWIYGGHDTIPLSCCQTWNYNIFLCSFHRVQIPLGMHIRIEKRFYCLFHLTKIIKHVSFLHKSYENSIVGYKMTKTDLCNWKQIFWHCFLGNIVISWVDITVWSSCNPLKLMEEI